MTIMLALLLLRAVVGAFMFVHGSQKLFGWFGGKGLRGAAVTMERRGLRPSRLWGATAATLMTAGAVGTALGLLSPLGPIAIAVSMLTVVTVDRHKGFFAHAGGNEHAYLYLTAAGALALSGPGDYSLDVLLRIVVPAAVVEAVIALAALGYLAMLASRGERLAGAPEAEASAK